MKKPCFKNEKGNIGLGVAIGAAGLSLMLGYARLNEIKHKADMAQQNNEKNFLSTLNMDSFQTVTSLMNSGDLSKNKPAALYPVDYVPNDLDCEKIRNLNTVNNSLVESSGTGVVIKSVSMTQDYGAVFNATKNNSGTVAAANQATNMTLLGFKCSSDPTKAYAIEAAYFESRTSLGKGKESTMIAEIPVSIPPRSDCSITLKNSTVTTTYMLAEAPAASPAPGPITADNLAITVQCNQVVTSLRVTDNYSDIGGDTSAPTNANTVSTTLKEMLGSAITITPGSHDLWVYATQPDGYVRQFNLKIVQEATKPPSYCEYKCTTVPGGVTAADKWQHSPCYEAHNICNWGWDPAAETGWICYQPQLYGPAGHKGVIWVFEPIDECNGRLVAQRGVDFPGCFVGETLITMHDGSQKRADRVSEGDMVHNPILNKEVRVKKVLKGPEIAELVEVALDDRKVTVSSKHTFMTRIGAVSISDLAVGDEILDVNGKYKAITAKREVPHAAAVPVYNFILDGDDRSITHLIVGGEIPSGDIMLQNRPIDPNSFRYAFDAP